MYTANARIMMDTRQTQVLDKDSGTNTALIDTGYVDSQVEVINSDDLILSVVRRLHLTEDPEFNGSNPGLLRPSLGKVMSLFDSGEPPIAGADRTCRGRADSEESRESNAF